MSLNRVFLGWDRPCLHSATDYLAETFAAGDVWDLSDVLVVVPGSRAGRRLLDLLVARRESLHPTAGNQPVQFVPPEIVTVGALPERLYSSEHHVFGDLQCLLAWTAALRGAQPVDLARIAPIPPPAGATARWVAIARDLALLHTELSAEGLDFADVARACRGRRGFSDAERWSALARIQDAYRGLLGECGLADIHDVRRSAQADGSKHVVLVSVVDIGRSLERLLRAYPGSVTAVIHAPAEISDRFDPVGRLQVGAWQRVDIGVPPGAVRFVDRPTDQAVAAVDAIRAAHGRCEFDQITVGVGDPGFSGLVGRILGLAGIPSHAPMGLPMAQTRPARLLAALAEYMEDGRADRFAALVRHPDVERVLSAAPGVNSDRLLTDLDVYIRDHLPITVGGRFPDGARSSAGLAAVAQAMDALTSGLGARIRPLSEWAPAVTGVLNAVYGRMELDRDRPDDDQLIHSLETIADGLRAIDGLAGSRLAPDSDAAEAIAILLGLSAGAAVPSPSRDRAVEILGWLEVQLDDAPVLVVTGLNEGVIPQTVAADAFLPDALRRELGLLDHQRRYARDAFALSAIVHSRPEVTLICGRRSAEGDPLSPSRLLFAAPDRDVVDRAARFYSDAPASPAQRGALLKPGGKCLFRLPAPVPLRDPITRLNVTAFRQYIACPYRFYLSHVLRLDGLDDSNMEMDGRSFGTMLHDILRGFGQSDVRHSTNAPAIEENLLGQLRRTARTRLGERRAPAVEIQIRQMERRLAAFAAWQAAHAAEGWRIQEEYIESEASGQLQTPDGPFEIVGRIDRIDRSEETGQYMLLDYKSGETAAKPEETHRRTVNGERVWVDLQLPLYRLMSPFHEAGAEGVQVGYVCLPKDVTKVGKVLADWSSEDYETAMSRALQVVRDIRAERFWPPSPEPPQFQDPFSGICFDGVANRGAIITGSVAAS